MARPFDRAFSPLNLAAKTAKLRAQPTEGVAMSASYMRRCASKKRHPDRESATAAAQALNRDKGLTVHAYRCDQCLGWHVGNAQKWFITRCRRAGKRPNKRLRGRV